MYWNYREWDEACESGRVEKEDLVLLKTCDEVDWNDCEKRQFEVKRTIVTYEIVEPPIKEDNK